MDQEVLVESQIEDGQKLIAELLRDGFPVKVACWVKPSEEDLWFLYIGSSSVKPGKFGDAYVTLYDCLDRIPKPSISLSQIKLIPATHPMAKEAVGIRDRDPGAALVRYRGKRLGKMAIEAASIYPPAKPVEILVQGREEVLRYLEGESQARTGKPGEYLLARDEWGRLVAFIAGHGFVGRGTLRLGDKHLVVVDGILIEARGE